MEPDIGLARKGRDAVADILNNLLADEVVLNTKTRSYHWNVTGPQFRELHAFFEEQYEALNVVVDEVAERVRALGAQPLGTLAEFAKAARLREDPGQRPAAAAMVQHLLHDHEALARQVRKDVAACEGTHGDAATVDFLTGVLRKHEHHAWMLRAHAEGRK